MDGREVAKNSSNHRSRNGEEDGAASVAGPSLEFGLQWGNRKRLRCMKQLGRNNGNSTNGERSKNRVFGIVDSNGKGKTTNPRQQVSPPRLPHVRALRKSEVVTMNNGIGTAVACVSSDRNGQKGEKGAVESKKGCTSPVGDKVHEATPNSKKRRASEGGEGEKGESSSRGTPEPPAGQLWLPKLVLALTTKEKEEDFMAIKGCKLPQRPKKRSKFVQRTLNLVSPGAWLCDLTLERYEVREKKTVKKKPRGLKAMGTMDSDSE